MFPNGSKVVFFLFLILFKFSRFAFCSCVSVGSGLFGFAWFVYVVFNVPKPAVHFGWAVFVY